jgi:alkylation response protein AidB-like acyl-CoA dehydrogenase
VTASPPSIWRERAAEFAVEVVAPLGMVLDRMEPAASWAGLAPLAEFIELATEEGFTRLTDRIADGGAGLSRAAEYEVLETLATADAGLTAVLTDIPLPFRLARRGPIQLGRRLGGAHLADGRAGRAGCIIALPGVPLQLCRDEAGWRLNGAAPETTAGSVATHAVIPCATGRFGTTAMVAIVALNREGVWRTPPAPSPGLRGRIPGRLVFDHMRLEPEEVLGERHGGDRMAASLHAIDDLSAAVGCIGVARAAYEGAARWRAERGLEATRRLARMRGELETARVGVRTVHSREYARLDTGEAMSGPQALSARTLAAQTAMSLARSAIALCGAEAGGDDGVPHRDGTRFQPAKLLRDATAGRPAGHGCSRPEAATAARPQRMGSIQWAT